MAKKPRLRRNEENDDICFDSLHNRDYIPIKTTPSFDITELFRGAIQRLAYSVYEQHDVTFLIGPAGSGKSHLSCMFAINELVRGTKKRIVLTRPIVEAGEKLGFLPGPQPLDAKIVTPTGWKKMGEIRLGDFVIGRDGKPTKVLGVYPKGKKAVFKVTTTENTTTECCEDHLWFTKTNEEKNGSVKFTKEIINSILDSNGEINHVLPRNKAVEYAFDGNLPLDPYALGVFLGKENLESSVSLADIDQDALNKTANSSVKDSINAINELGLLGVKSHNKFIPEVYKYAFIDDRINLLRGLMDVNGKLKRDGKVSFITTSRKLALDMAELVRSLGGKAVLSKAKIERTISRENGEEIVRRKILYKIVLNFSDINPFSVSKKTSYFSNKRSDCVGIKSIVFSGEKEVQCILVENSEHLYLTDDFIVTHNTFSEKTDPYMLPLYDCIHKMVPHGGSLAEFIQKSSGVEPIAYMRGRAQPLESKILTPKGFKKMGSIKVGDFVCGKNGHPTKVLGVYPQGKLDVYRMYFSDGTSVECSGDHLWSTMTLNEKRHGKDFSVKNTVQILETVKDKYNRKVHRIPVADVVFFENSSVLPVNPYILGVLLGDNNAHKKVSITITNTNQELINNVLQDLPENLKLVAAKVCDGKSPQYRLVGKKGESNPIRKYLQDKEILGLKSYQKFIPTEYLYSPQSFRLDLLRGLMDVSGSVSEHCNGISNVQYYSTSRRLAEAVRFLVHSFGGTALLRKSEHSEGEHQGKTIRHCRPLFVVDIVMALNPFKVKSKANKFKPMKPQRLISKVEHVGKKACQCIKVEAKDSLYLTEHCIVTHNTFDDSVCILDEAQNCTWGQLVLFLTRLGENSKMIVTGDPSQSDIGRDVALMDVVHRLEGLEGVGIMKFTEEHIVRHKLVAQMIKRLQKNV